MSITEEMDLLEMRIAEQIEIAFAKNAKHPTQLVLSEYPYRALRQLCLMKMIAPILDTELKEYQGLKIIRLNRHDKEIIEVG